MYISRYFHAAAAPLYLVLCVALLLTPVGCGTTTEKGGDHVPTDKAYPASELPGGALPSGSNFRTIVPKEYDSDVLGRFVHVAENYRVCLIKDQFGAAELSEIQSFISNRAGAINQYGLEGLINYTFATLQQFDSGKARFSSRVSLQVVWNDGYCDVVIGKAATGDFPFRHEDFAGRRRVLLHSGQIRGGSGDSNAVPVGWILATDAADQNIQIQKLLSSYLGFAESATAASYINADASAQSATTWNLVDGNSNLIVGDDSLKLYSFAVAWSDILKPRDLDRFHYYEDSFHNGPVATDPLLDLSNAADPAAFTDLPGNRYLEGARKLSGPVGVCFRDHSGKSLSADMVAAWTSFFSPDQADGIHGQLKALDESFTGSAVLRSTDCQLLISFRNNEQYPFTSMKANGAYAHEGRVAAANGTASRVPVIYINTTDLLLSTETQGMASARHISLVLQHEYAHFLGLKHSSDADSLLSPAGSGRSWSIADRLRLNEYLKYAK